MANWYKEAQLRQKLKQIARPALLMAPLGLAVGLMGNDPKPQQVQQVQPDVPIVQPATQPTTKPTTQPTSQPATTQPTTKPTTLPSRITEMLKLHEGNKLTMYKDTKGIETIGIGFNLRKKGAKERIEALGLDYEKVLAGQQPLTNQQVETLFDEDVKIADADLRKVIPDIDEHPQHVKDVLLDMMFNLGINRFAGFKNMIAAVQAGNYVEARDEMIQSKWYHQVRNRAKTLTKMMVDDPSATQLNR